MEGDPRLSSSAGRLLLAGDTGPPAHPLMWSLIQLALPSFLRRPSPHLRHSSTSLSHSCTEEKKGRWRGVGERHASLAAAGGHRQLQHLQAALLASQPGNSSPHAGLAGFLSTHCKHSGRSMRRVSRDGGWL